MSADDMAEQDPPTPLNPHRRELDWGAAYNAILVAEFERNRARLLVTGTVSGTGVIAKELHLFALLAERDGFIPTGVTRLDQADIRQLLPVPGRMYREEYPGAGYLGYYRSALQKMVTLGVQRLPDVFDQLSEEDRRMLVNWKMELPTERELYYCAYGVILGAVRSPYMYAFQDIIGFFGRHVDDRAVVDKLHTIHAQYAVYFRDRLARGQGPGP